MNKLILISIFACILTCCNSTREKKIEKSDKTSYISYKERLFISPSFSDTLSSFMNSVDSISNPYGAKKLTLITIEKNKKDTLISFVAHIGLYKIINTSSKCVFKGGCFIDGEYVALYYCGFDNLKNVINEKLLSFEYAKKISDFFDNAEIYDWSYLYPEWIYKLSNGKLIPVEKRNRT